jgi:molybdate/tungstate transport system substrate-binding protein
VSSVLDKIQGQGRDWQNNVSPNFIGNVIVFYDGSLDNLLSLHVNPGFQRMYNIQVIEVPAASGDLAANLASGSPADVFISASTSYDTPASNISWYTYWAKTQLGIGYNTKSRYATRLNAIANDSVPWYLGLDKTTMKIGRTDPNTDPKGARTVILARLANLYYNRTDIETRILGSPRNNLQVYNEDYLEQMLQEGTIDVGFFYKCEQSWASTANLRFISLPVRMDFSDPSYNTYYAKVRSVYQSEYR